jgi:hypothetical protein
MKYLKLKGIVLLGVMFFSHSVFAYNAGNVEKKCKPPKFKDFNPPEKTKDSPVPEVAAEAEISFTVSGFADPTTIRAFAKKEKLKLDIIDKNSFYKVSSKLPASLNGKYARIDLRVKAQSGECHTKGGWLIKINKAESGSSTTEKE